MPKLKTNKVTPDLTSVSSKKMHAHFKMRRTGIDQRHKLLLAKVKQTKEVRMKDAKSVRTSPGLRFEYPMGGSYAQVLEFNKTYREVVYMEANHTPAEDSYVDSPYAGIPRGIRPAHSMLFYHHRNPRGELGGASSTGGSGVNKAWSAEKIRDLMKAGNFGEAMYTDIIDLTNTTYPNRGYYALALYRAAVYAKGIGLMDQTALDKIGALLADYMHAEDIGEAFGDRDLVM